MVLIYSIFINGEFMRKFYKASLCIGGKVIHREQCKQLKFDHNGKCNIQKPKIVQENKTHKILWYFEIKMYPPISVRSLDRVGINKMK